MSALSAVRLPSFVAVALVAAAGVASAQGTEKPKHTPVCGAAVRVYHEKADVPAPHDTIPMPPGPPVRVTSPEEAEAAELAMRERAGSVGANAVLVATETTESDGNMQMRRTVTAVYVPADSARAVAACKK